MQSKKPSPFPGSASSTGGDLQFLDATVEVLQKTINDLSRKLARMSDEKWAKDLEIEEMRTHHLSTQTELAKLREEVSGYSKNLFEATDKKAALERLLSETQTKLQYANEESSRSLRQAKQTQLHELEFLQETNNALNQQVSHLTSEGIRMQSEIVAFDQKVKESELSQAEHDRQTLELRQQLTETRAKYDSVLKKVESATSETTQSQLHYGQEKTRFQKRIEELEIECQEQASQIDQARDVVAAFEQALEATQLDLQNAREQAVRTLRETNQQNAQRTETLAQQQVSMSNDIAKFRADETRLKRALSEAQAENVELRTKLETEYESKMEGVIADNLQLRKVLEMKEALAEELQNKLQSLQMQSESREQMLRSNAESTAREKSDVNRLAKQLVNELQMARATHPLKDYLGLTESELTKLYTSLKAAPLNTPERARLEDAMTKMLKKREFLNSVLQQSQKHLEDKANMVLGTLQGMTSAQIAQAATANAQKAPVTNEAPSAEMQN